MKYRINRVASILLLVACAVLLSGNVWADTEVLVFGGKLIFSLPNGVVDVSEGNPGVLVLKTPDGRFSIGVADAAELKDIARKHIDMIRRNSTCEGIPTLTDITLGNRWPAAAASFRCSTPSNGMVGHVVIAFEAAGSRYVGMGIDIEPKMASFILARGRIAGQSKVTLLSAFGGKLEFAIPTNVVFDDTPAEERGSELYLTAPDGMFFVTADGPTPGTADIAVLGEQVMSGFRKLHGQVDSLSSEPLVLENGWPAHHFAFMGKYLPDKPTERMNIIVFNADGLLCHALIMGEDIRLPHMIIERGRSTSRVAAPASRAAAAAPVDRASSNGGRGYIPIAALGAVAAVALIVLFIRRRKYRAAVDVIEDYLRASQAEHGIPALKQSLISEGYSIKAIDEAIGRLK